MIDSDVDYGARYPKKNKAYLPVSDQCELMLDYCD